MSTTADAESSVLTTINTKDPTKGEVPAKLKELEEIDRLTQEGKKAFSLQNYETAIAKFGEASRLVGQHYGEESTLYADALVYYGRSLLENYIAQSTVLGRQALPKEAELPAAGKETDDQLAINKDHFQFEGEPDFSNFEEDYEIEQEQSEGANTAEDDLTVAWESLDAARVIYSKVDDNPAKLFLGDIYITLGDVSLESENFDQAVYDFREGLQIKLKRLPDDDRQLAEAHYKLALALELSSELRTQGPDLAMEHVQKATDILQKRSLILDAQLMSLQEQQSGKGKGLAMTSDDMQRIEKEIKEINELLPEMEAKVEDLKNTKKTRETVENALNLDAMLKSALNSATASTSIPVNDITSLIKRKSENDAPNEDSQSVDNTSSTQAEKLENQPLLDANQTVRVEEKKRKSVGENSEETSKKIKL